MRQSTRLGRLNLSVIATIEEILRRGQAGGVFSSRVDAIDLHMMISSFCFFRVSNRHTFGLIFARDLAEPSTRERHRTMMQDAVLAFLTTPDAP